MLCTCGTNLLSLNSSGLDCLQALYSLFLQEWPWNVGQDHNSSNIFKTSTVLLYILSKTPFKLCPTTHFFGTVFRAEQIHLIIRKFFHRTKSCCSQWFWFLTKTTKLHEVSWKIKDLSELVKDDRQVQKRERQGMHKNCMHTDKVPDSSLAYKSRLEDCFLIVSLSMKFTSGQFPLLCSRPGVEFPLYSAAYILYNEQNATWSVLKRLLEVQWSTFCDYC